MMFGRDLGLWGRVSGTPSVFRTSRCMFKCPEFLGQVVADIVEIQISHLDADTAGTKLRVSNCIADRVDHHVAVRQWHSIQITVEIEWTDR